MRRTMVTVGAVFVLSMTATFTPGPVNAMTIAAPAGMQAAIGSGLVQDAAYICRPVWRCGYYGCGWRRACWWSGPYYWRHRYWRHHYWHHW